MLMPPEPGELRWNQTGNVMCMDIASAAEGEWLREQVADEEERLDRRLERNHSILFLTGIGSYAMALDAHAYEQGAGAAIEEIAAIRDVSTEAVAQELEEKGSGPIKVDGNTQFRVAKNVQEEEPCDPDHETDILYVVIHNGPDPDDHSVVEVGSREIGADGEQDVFSPAVQSMPGDLWLSVQGVAVVGSLIDGFDQEITAGRFPNLGRSGYHDTLVVKGVSSPSDNPVI